MAGGYNWQPPYEQMLAGELRNLQNQINALRQGLVGLGIQIDPNGNLIFDATGKNIIIKNGSGLDIQDDGTLHVAGDTTLDGDLTATSGTLKSGNYVAGASGWRLLPTGNVEINDLTLRGGIIGNAALANPTSFGITWNDNNTTNLTVPGVILAPMALTVPAGFTRALVVCNGTVGNSRNVGAGAAPFYIAAQIASSAAATIASTCADGGGMSLTSMWVANLTGLTPGGTISASVWAAVDSTAGWATGAANAHTVMYATFLR